MANIKEWLVKAEITNNETITHIVVGVHDNDIFSEDRRPENQRDVVLNRDDGLALVDEEFNDGYGGADCFPITAWSENWIYFIREYDGATGLGSVPRNPIDHKPEFM